jgi:hypothetical protein
MDNNGKSIIEALEELRKSMAAGDPLQQKGIGEDWVCCMSSQTYAALKRQADERNPLSYPGFVGVGSIDRVATLVRRRVFIFDDLSYGRLEYMPFLQAYARDAILMQQVRDIQGDGSLTPIDDDQSAQG